MLLKYILEPSLWVIFIVWSCSCMCVFTYVSMEINHVCCLLRQRVWLARESQKFIHLSRITGVHYMGSGNWTRISILALQALYQPYLTFKLQLDQQGTQKNPVMALRNANKYNLHCLITEFSICFFPFLSELVLFWCSNFL